MEMKYAGVRNGGQKRLLKDTAKHTFLQMF